MVGLPQAVFLHNRFSRSFLLSFLPTPLPLILQDPEVAATKCKKEGNAHLATGAPPTPCYHPPPAPVTASSTFCFFFYSSFNVRLRPVSPYVGRYTPCHRAFSFAGGCILITFMSSDIPARFIAPAPMDSAKTLQDPSLTTASKISFSQSTSTNIESFQQGTLVALGWPKQKIVFLIREDFCLIF